MVLTLLEFETEVRSAISVLTYVKTIEIKPRTEISIQGIIGLTKNYKLTVFYNEAFYVLSFSLIYKDNRIWAIDKDNRVGWHEHPLENPNEHIPINTLEINQIIAAFDKVCELLNIKQV